MLRGGPDDTPTSRPHQTSFATNDSSWSFSSMRMVWRQRFFLFVVVQKRSTVPNVWHQLGTRLRGLRARCGNHGRVHDIWQHHRVDGHLSHLWSGPGPVAGRCRSDGDRHPDHFVSAHIWRLARGRPLPSTTITRRYCPGRGMAESQVLIG